MSDAMKYINPEILSKLSRLEIKAREIVEGAITGIHKSPHHGFSVEFAEHREYVPGDDIRHIDWKVFGRSDRFYIKQYEEETNLYAYILMDTSESMRYGNKISKFDYGAYITASLAYLILKQQDMVGLVNFSDKIDKVIPASGNTSHLKEICRALAEAESGKKTDIGQILHMAAEKIKRRGVIIIVSDMLDNLENILFGLRHLRHKRHDVMLFHVLDYDEIHFPFEQMSKFIGLEDHPELMINPRAVRDSYLEEVQNFCEQLKGGCMRNRVDYIGLDTSQPLDIAISSYLAARTGRLS